VTATPTHSFGVACPILRCPGVTLAMGSAAGLSPLHNRTSTGFGFGRAVAAVDDALLTFDGLTL
jgi:hypothetical protein